MGGRDLLDYPTESEEWVTSSCSPLVLLNLEGIIFSPLSYGCHNYALANGHFPALPKPVDDIFVSPFLFFFLLPSPSSFLFLSFFGRCHLCTFPLLPSRTPVYSRGELLHISGAPVFISVTWFLQLPLITWLWRQRGT